MVWKTRRNLKRHGFVRFCMHRLSHRRLEFSSRNINYCCCLRIFADVIQVKFNPCWFEFLFQLHNFIHARLMAIWCNIVSSTFPHQKKNAALLPIKCGRLMVGNPYENILLTWQAWQATSRQQAGGRPKMQQRNSCWIRIQTANIFNLLVIQGHQFLNSIKCCV